VRYAKSGTSDEALAIATSDAREIMTGGITTGRVFRLRSIQLTNEHVSQDAVVKLFDSAEGAQSDDTACVTAIVVPARSTVIADFDPGLLFKTNLTAGLEAATGTFGAYKQSACGYEE
jgi:hypothetical protein